MARLALVLVVLSLDLIVQVGQTPGAVGTARDARADAALVTQAYAATVQGPRLRAETDASRALAAGYRSCLSRLGKITPTVQGRIGEALDAFDSRFLAPKLAAPAYLLFAQKVGMYQTAYAPVAQVIRDIRSMAEQVKRLNRYKFILCPYLILWRHHGWDLNYGFRLTGLAYQRAGVNLTQVDRIKRDARSTFDELQKLGLSFGEALNFRFTVMYLP